MKTTWLLASIPFSCLLAACAAPQAELDQANNGVALTASLDSELREFRRAQAVVAAGRIDSVKRQRARLATYESDGAFDERVKRLAGNAQQVDLYTTLKDLSDSRAQDERNLTKKLSDLDEAFAKLVAPLPDASPSLATSKATLAKLGEDLSVKERIATAASFAKKIKKSVDENRKKIADAEAAAPTATAPSAATPTQ